MKELLYKLIPNFMNYSDRFLESLSATFQMFFIAGAITLLLGGLFGILLVITRPDGIKPNKFIHSVLEIITNIFRSIPFIILLIFLIPFTRTLVGTSIGVNGKRYPGDHIQGIPEGSPS